MLYIRDITACMDTLTLFFKWDDDHEETFMGLESIPEMRQFFYDSTWADAQEEALEPAFMCGYNEYHHYITFEEALRTPQFIAQYLIKSKYNKWQKSTRITKFAQ